MQLIQVLKRLFPSREVTKIKKSRLVLRDYGSVFSNWEWNWDLPSEWRALEEEVFSDTIRNSNVRNINEPTHY